MIDGLVGGLLGGVFRMAPEILKWVDRKNERAHELAMFSNQLAADKLRGEQQLAQADVAISAAEIQAIIEATKAQATPTGIKWVDAFSSLIRPLMAAQWIILLWPSVVVAGFLLAVANGADPLVALKSAFGAEEHAMATSVASFWLVDRSCRRIFRTK